jgi:hypothetical protein
VTRLVEVGSPEPHSGQVSIRGSHVKVSAGCLYWICRLGTSADPAGQRFGARPRRHTIAMRAGTLNAGGNQIIQTPASAANGGPISRGPIPVTMGGNIKPGEGGFDGRRCLQRFRPYG